MSSNKKLANFLFLLLNTPGRISARYKLRSCLFVTGLLFGAYGSQVQSLCEQNIIEGTGSDFGRQMVMIKPGIVEVVDADETNGGKRSK